MSAPAESVYQLRRLLEAAPKTLDGRPLLCNPSVWDPRDYKYPNLVTSATTGPAAAAVDYRGNLPPVYDQGQRGSCVSAGWVGTVKAFHEMSQGDYPAWGLSVAFHYSLQKGLDGLAGQEGSTPRAGAQVLQKYGVCAEQLFPYRLLSDLPPPQVPIVPDSLIPQADKYKINTYAQICSISDTNRTGLLNTMRQALINEGPFVLALLVCENFAPEGPDYKLPLPQGRILGGHLVGIVGDLPDKGALILRNSWGPAWGQNGYALLPYEWLTSRYDMGWYVYEAWTATDIIVPKAAREIVIERDTYAMIVDGQEIFLDEAATISGRGRLRIPLRAVTGNCGYIVTWDGKRAILRRPN